MLKKIILAAAFFTLPMISVADELQINDGAPETYIVEKGDTLWDISSLFLEQPWLWPQLWRLNPEISNPHLIYPGDVLRLVYDDQGEPQLIVEEPEVIEEVLEEVVIIEEPEVVEEIVPVVKVKPTIKLGPKPRKQEKVTPINTIALHEIAPYIRYENLLTQEQLDVTPYVLGSDEGQKSSLTDFKLYVTDNLKLGQTYAIYQKGEEIIDPDTELSLGFSMQLAGTGQAIRKGDMDNKIPGTLKVSKSNREIRAGNFIVPLHDGQLLPSFFTMQAADPFLRGKIIKSSSGGREFGKLEVIMINRGDVHKVKAGDIMLINRQSKGVVESGDGPQYIEDSSRWSRMANGGDSEYNMPEESIGQVMIFKVFENASLALIMKTEKPIRLLDAVTAP